MKTLIKKHLVSWVFANLRLASCPWGPVTVNGADLLTEIYVIYMEAHTSHRATARCFGSRTFTNFGTLPATLAPCQYWETYLKGASHRSLTFGKLPKLVGMLPKAAAGEAVTDARTEGKLGNI